MEIKCNCNKIMKVDKEHSNYYKCKKCKLAFWIEWDYLEDEE
jgi:hypothetical protein